MLDNENTYSAAQAQRRTHSNFFQNTRVCSTSRASTVPDKPTRRMLECLKATSNICSLSSDKIPRVSNAQASSASAHSLLCPLEHKEIFMGFCSQA